jgi:hypothetical protein
LIILIILGEEYTFDTSVVKLLEFLPTYPDVPGSIPYAIRFSEKVVGLEQGPLSLVRIFEELFQGNSGSGLENRD